VRKRASLDLEQAISVALADLRARGLKLVPVCRFVRAYLRRHPDQADLVTGERAVPRDHAHPS
jgi:GCN5-related N-acetyl-transferase